MKHSNAFSKMNKITPNSRKFRIIKNLIAMSLSLMLTFTAYDGLSMLQSTMNNENNIGTISQTVVYVGMCLSSLILPKYAIQKLGSKIIFVIAAVLFIPYISANFYPCWLTMMPSAFLMGMGASMIWTAQSSYFNENVVLYCEVNHSSTVQEIHVNPYVVSNSDCTSLEVLPDINSNCTSVEVLSDSNSNCRSVGVFPSEISNGTAAETHFENECNSTSGEVLSEISPNNLNLLISPLKKLLSNDVTVKQSSNHLHDSHMQHHLNSQSFGIFPCEIMKLKGEIMSDIENVRSRYPNRNKLIVSIISNNTEDCSRSSAFVRYDTPENVVMKPLPELEVESRTKIENISEFPGQENNRIVPNGYKAIPISNPRKSMGYIDGLDRTTNIESVTARFFGANGLVFHSAQIWSNLVSYYVLQNNSIGNPVLDSGCSCGATVCNTESECLVEISGGTNDSMKNLLTGSSVLLAVLAVILALLFVDPLKKEVKPVTFSLNKVMATFNHCKKNVQLCLVPISLYVGMIQGFYTAEFTKSYIACAWGTSQVGLVTVSYGVACALSSTLSGYLVKHTGRIPIFLLTHIINIAINIFLLIWIPNPDHPYMFHLAAGIWGLVTGILWSQIPAFYGILFKKDEEAAFGSYYLFNSLGWAVTFACSDFLCTSVKIYILMAVSSLGILGYLVAERMYSTRKKQIALHYLDAQKKCQQL